MTEVKALAIQSLIFAVGLVVSLVVGIALGGVLEGPGGLLVATVIAGAGLLGAAVLSQVVHDLILQRDFDAT